LSVKDVLNSKDAHLNSLIIKFEKEFVAFDTKIRTRLSKLLRSPKISRAGIEALFKELGYETLIAKFINEYKSVIKFSKQLSTELGISVILPNRSLFLLNMLKQHSNLKMLHANTAIIDTMMDAGLRFHIEGLSLGSITTEIEKGMGLLGRRISTEAFTGISTYGRTLNSEQYKAADIELFFYDGPVDSHNRDECRAVLNDPRQATGWSRDDIAGSPVDFTTGGGWNCRHEFIPFLPEAQILINEMVSDAQINE
jgi:hypothetical protein